MGSQPSGLIANVGNRDFVLAHLAAVAPHVPALAHPHERRGLLARIGHDVREAFERLEPRPAHELEDAVRAVEQSLALHREAAAAPHDDVAFVPRDPIASLLQSALEQRIEAKLGDRLVPAADAGLGAHAGRVLVPPDGSTPDRERMGDAFTLDDPRWEIDIACALLQRVLRGGRRPFNPHPAPAVPLAGDARLVVIGDWGSGLPRALEVARHAGRWIEEARAAGRETHAIHLGDVYYAGEPAEYDKRLLAAGAWPVAAADAAATPSWSLNGNHDMYSGGYGFFDHLLADPRFRLQRSEDGRPTSWFELAGPEWHVIGLDTSWNDHPITHGQWGWLEPPQADVVAAAAAAGDRKLLLLSHHQLFSAYEKVGPEVAQALAQPLRSGRVRVWIWGHEHRCMSFRPHAGVEFGRCVGHGGVPVVAHAPDAPVPAPGEWEYRGQFESGGRRWARFGFAVLDFDGPAIAVSYVDELGDVVRTETFA